MRVNEFRTVEELVEAFTNYVNDKVCMDSFCDKGLPPKAGEGQAVLVTGDGRPEITRIPWPKECRDRTWGMEAGDP